MSGLSNEISEKTKKAGKKAINKVERTFAILDLREAKEEAKQAHAGTMISTEMCFDKEIKDGIAHDLEPLFQELDKVCTDIKTKFHLELIPLELPVVPLTITVTTGQTLWTMIEENNRWKRQLEREFVIIVCEQIRICTDKINKVGCDVLGILKSLYDFLGLSDYMAGDEEGSKAVSENLGDAKRGILTLGKEVMQQFGDCQTRIESLCEAWLYDFIKQQIKAEKAILKVVATKTFAIVSDGAIIGAHAAHTGASFGITAPLAIVGIVRDGADIITIIATSALSMDKLGQGIDMMIAAVKEHYTGKAVAIGEEILMTAAKGVLNIPLPSLDTCKQLVKEYEHKIRLLEASYNQLQRQLTEIFKRQELYRKALAQLEAQGRVTPQLTKVWDQMMAKLKELMNSLIKESDDKDKRIDIAKVNVVNWKNDLSEIDPIVGTVGKITAKTTKVLTGVALGSFDVGGEIITEGAHLVEHVFELFGQAVTLVYEEGSEIFLQIVEK